MISFYPGPSRVHDEIPRYVKEAHEKGLLSLNHRSDEFMEIYNKTISLLKQKLEIPKTYTVFFASSATECWEIIAQSLIIKKSTHLYNGAFGEKWFQYTKRLQPEAHAFQFDAQTPLKANQLIFSDSDLICITQNETSNGTQVSNSAIQVIKSKNPHAILAVDATSSMAGIELKFKTADIWFASVQKCFGLPAGLAMLICSPRVTERMNLVGDRNHYNSLCFIKEMSDKSQTVCTPNVLGIYLLMRILEKSKKISEVSAQTKKRASHWFKYFESKKTVSLFTKSDKVRSNTILCVYSSPQHIQFIKDKAKKKGFLLGEGYGALKTNTFRIANFPALKDVEIKRLMNFLDSVI